MTPFFIYALIDPRDGRAFYVGATKNGWARVKRHSYVSTLSTEENSNRQKTAKIKSLPWRFPGLPYDVKILQNFDTPIGPFLVEDEWIERLKAEGEPLLNLGRGGLAAQLGRPHTEATKAKLRAAHIGIKASAETRAKMSLARKGKPVPANFLWPKGRKQSPEHIAARFADRVETVEGKTRRIAVHKGAKRSPEALANMREAQRKQRSGGNTPAQDRTVTILRSPEVVARALKSLRSEATSVKLRAAAARRQRDAEGRMI